jgi:hypothetical protein
MLPQHQSNKHAILQSAVEYMRKLKRQGEHLILLNKELREENEEILRFLQSTSVFFGNRLAENPEMMYMPTMPPSLEPSQPPHFPPSMPVGQFPEAEAHPLHVPYSSPASSLSHLPGLYTPATVASPTEIPEPSFTKNEQEQ